MLSISSSRAPLIAAALAALLAAGCGDSKKKMPSILRAVGDPCTTLGQCASGLCLSGRCAAAAPASSACSLPHVPAIVTGAVAGPADDPGTCVLGPRAIVPGGNVLLERGEHAVGETVTFDVPAGTSAVSIVSQRVGADAAAAAETVEFFQMPFANTVVPDDVRLPDGSLLFSDVAPLPATPDGKYADLTKVLAFYPVGDTPISSAFTVPATTPFLDRVQTAGSVPAGTWQMKVNDYAFECATFEPFKSSCSGASTAARYRIDVLARPGPLASTGTLDLHLYLVTTNPAYTAAGAPGDPLFQRLVSGMARFFANAGICLGTVTFHDVQPWAAQRFHTVSADTTAPCDELSQLFTLAVPEGGVHLFLVDDLTSSSNDGGTVLMGLDGSIPGPSGVPGTVFSGAAVTIADLGAADPDAPAACSQPFDLRCGTDTAAYVAAHEAGHWLGLFHTTEALGTSFDTLTDTGTCRCAACAQVGQASCLDRDPSTSTPTIMEPTWCGTSSCAGTQNLMFWVITPGLSEGQLSPQQGTVMRLNPAVR